MHKELKLHYIKQGEVFIAEEPLIFKTTLGSCVSVCLWDPGKQIGGINHYTRPLCHRDGTHLKMCGEHAIKALIEGFLKRGSRKSDLRAGVFGGGNLLDIETYGLRVGPSNIDMAFLLLKAHGIRVVKSSTGHTHGLNVYFNTLDGSMRTENVRNIYSMKNRHKGPTNVPDKFLERVEELRYKFNNAFKEDDPDNA